MTTSSDYAATLLRVSSGVLFLAHGLLKVNVFTVAGTVGYFESLGLPGFRISREPAHRQEAGTLHARYAVLHLDGDSVQVEMLAIAYDWDAAARRAEEVGFNDTWSHVIRTGLLHESA